MSQIGGLQENVVAYLEGGVVPVRYERGSIIMFVSRRAGGG